MHGPTSGVSLLVNTDADSMEGIVDYGVGVGPKASPRRAAIEEAQAELQQEYDVREQRRRELEFLLKGGNPLDFKSARSASISIHSTSPADQLAEQYVTSETKGSFAMAASPQADSIESSGRPGSVAYRNPDTDNVSIYDGDNSNLDCDINAKRRGKRGSAILLGQPSKIDSSSNAKESEAAASLRIGAKGQAYARRRSKPSRNSSNFVPANHGLHHGNTNSIMSSTTSYPRGTKAPLPEVHAPGCTVNDPKADSLSGKIGSDNKISHAHLDAVDNIMVMDDTKLEADEMKITENKQKHDQSNHSEVADRAPNSVNSQSSRVIGRDEALSVDVLESNGNNKVIISDENINVSSALELTMLDKNMCQTTEIATENDQTQDHFSLNGTRDIEENSNRDQSLLLTTKEKDGGLKGDPYPRSSILQDGNDLKDSQLIALNVPANIYNESGPIHVDTETKVFTNKNDMQSATVPVPNTDCVESNGEFTSEPRTQVDNSSSDPKFVKDAGATASALISSTHETLKTTPPQENSASSKLQNSQQLELAKKMHEDDILKEALKIQANRKWAGELSICYKTSEKGHKCHWDFVLEEMSWAANDFMQERLWKIATAAQFAKHIAYNSQAVSEKFSLPRKQKKIARTLTKAIMQFWHSAEVLRRSDGSPVGAHQEYDSNMLDTWKANGIDDKKDQGKGSTMSELSRPVLRFAVQDYAVRFLKDQSRSAEYSPSAVAPATPDRENDIGILEFSSEEQLPDESLFYVVPPGAMQVYRDSMESQCVHYKKAGNARNQEDCEMSMCGSVADGLRDNVYEEDQGDTFTYVLPGASSSGLSSKFTLKKKLMHQKSYASKLYEVGNGLTYEPGMESKSGNQPFPLNGKRPSSAINVGSIPTKRIRTAARRVIPPYTSGLASSMQVTSKTDVSSGDTSSLQDDQSSLNGGSLLRKNLEVESTMDFDRQMQFDGNDVMTSKKKKKPKHLGYKNSLNLDGSSFLVAGKSSSYEQRLQVDRLAQDEHKDHAKRRLEIQHFDSNGLAAVSYGQHGAKKPKHMKQLPDTLPDVLTPATGSMPSPVASQMSNMSNSNKLLKIIANRDRGRKSKGLKVPAGHSGTGSQWSNFEDQALVVLVHDMGPNWELVSDAINSTLQFKCIFRKPKECKERHKFLMDKSAGDGADSAEDSGSSQPYPSTLPGIPKGSARQLFQRLQGPMEEDTLRTHFDKIISLNQQLQSCRRQESKQIIPPHNSHVVALSQVCPSGGILTPLDLCESTTSGPDLFSPGYQGFQSGLAVGNHPGSMTPIHPSGANTFQASPGVVLTSSLPPPPTPMSISPRDAQRYALPRPSTLPVDDQQRMQQYSPMLSGRNIQQSSLPIPGSYPVGVDRGVRMLAGGNGMGMMCGMPRSMPMPRPGFQGLNSAGMLNMVSASNMISSSVHGMQNQINVHPAAVSAAGNSMLRPRDSLQMLRPGQNTDMMMQELQVQASQANGQTITPFTGMGASFSNAAVASTIQTFPLQQQGHMLGNSHQPHIQGANQASSQQSYAIQQRKLQQRMIPQPHHSFSGVNAVSPGQNNSQVHSQIQSTSSVTAVSSSQVQNKQQNMPRNSQSNIQNQIMKQRQRQQPQQQQPQPRQHQQQRQQPQQQAKLMKGGLGRGNTVLPTNLPGDSSQMNGPSTAPKSQAPEKHLMQQNQGFFPSGSSMNSGQTKIYAGSLPQSAKQVTAVSDACSQSLADPSNTHMVVSQQSPIPSPVSLPSIHQQPQPQSRYVSQNQQTIQKMVQQNRQPESNSRIQTTTDQGQVNPITSASVSQCTVLSTSAPMVSPTIPWKPESSYDKNTCTKSVLVPNSSSEIVGSDTLPTSSGQGMVPPQQCSGTVSLHGHTTGGQWQQTPQPQHQLQQPQHQIRQTVQGELSTHPSNSAPG